MVGRKLSPGPPPPGINLGPWADRLLETPKSAEFDLQITAQILHVAKPTRSVVPFPPMTSPQWKIEAGARTMKCLGEDLRRYFRRRVHNTPTAEDLVNETWLAAGRTFEGRCTLRGYLFGIARRKIRDWVLRSERRPWFNQVALNSAVSTNDDDDDDDDGLDLLLLAADGPDPETWLSDFIDRLYFRRAVASIPEPFCKPVELRLQGFSFVEIADMLSVNYNTVRSQFSRGVDHLKKLIEAELDSDDDDWPVLEGGD